jgi:hypothetical protein
MAYSVALELDRWKKSSYNSATTGIQTFDVQHSMIITMGK